MREDAAFTTICSGFRLEWYVHIRGFFVNVVRRSAENCLQFTVRTYEAHALCAIEVVHGGWYGSHGERRGLRLVRVTTGYSCKEEKMKQ